ncbi:hypothetical protein AAAK29_29810 [Mesorhizobium sp. CCNWLW179-1]|uniref:hypothetical protein n=1 Tax=unclassified Mesorhizobium TaxID=325217 RepID=UPI0030155190
MAIVPTGKWIEGGILPTRFEHIDFDEPSLWYPKGSGIGVSFDHLRQAVKEAMTVPFSDRNDAAFIKTTAGSHYDWPAIGTLYQLLKTKEGL